MSRIAVRALLLATLATGLLMGLGSGATAATPALRIVAPVEGARVAGPTVDLVVGAPAAAGGPVRFTVAVDGTPADANGNPASPGSGGATFSVAAGGRTTVTLRALPAGSHRVVVTAISPAGLAPASATFTITSAAGRPPWAVLLGVALFALAWLFMRRRMGTLDRSFGGGRGGPRADGDGR